MMTKNTKTRGNTYICLVAAFGGFLFGFDTAVISGTLKLMAAQFKMDALLEGSLVSSNLMGCIIGVFLTGILSDRVGRKKMLLLAALLFTISGIGCFFAGSADLLILGRLIGGIGVGVASVVSPMYISEVAASSQRGRMVACYQLAITLGICTAYFSNAWIMSSSEEVGHFFSFQVHHQIWQRMFLAIVFPAVLFMVMLLFIPERSSGLKVNVKSGQVVTDTALKKNIRLPLIIGIALAILQQFSGINAIIYYGPKIFEAAGLTNGKALQAQVVIGIINVFFTFIAIILSDKLGRRPLFLTGLAGMVISLLTAGICFYTGQSSGILLLLSLLTFIACFAFSAGPLTWVVINEIFPNEFRAKAISVCTFALWFSVWLVGQFFPWLLQKLGPAGVFWIFAIFSLTNLTFCFKFLVETKDKSLGEMDGIFLPDNAKV